MSGKYALADMPWIGTYGVKLSLTCIHAPSGAYSLLPSTLWVPSTTALYIEASLAFVCLHASSQQLLQRVPEVEELLPLPSES